MAVVTRGGVSNLPAEVTSFVGRRQATAGVKQLLSESRLVTLTGVGGVGKSRLAFHVTGELRRAFPDGVWFVQLARVQDPLLVTQTVAVTLNLLDQSVRDPETVLVDYVAKRRLLLLLDNCEHLLGACSQIANVLLCAAPGLPILSTSREPLGLESEHIFPVPSLSVPGDEASSSQRSQYEALMLFEERAAAS